ncbi:MAG TPA: hypothetical protein VKY89_16245 [Thermoanaerobaculia bacterium]|jgi:hypothetical protein|nr:hypothetical protein [Thermoanaerobaculia bacterium]
MRTPPALAPIATTSIFRVCLLAGMAVIPLPTMAEPAAPNQCPRVSFSSPRPNWISSALAANGKILAVDSAVNHLLTIAPSGQVTVVPQPVGSMPALLATSGKGFLLKLVGLDVLHLGEDLSVRSPEKFLRTAASSDGTVGSIFQWVGLTDSVLAFGSLRSPHLPDGYELGFLRIPTTPAPARTSLLAPPLQGDFYLLGNQYVAALGETGYFLRMESGLKAGLFEVAPGATEATAMPETLIPEDFRTVPSFDATMSGPADAPAVYARIEKMTLAAGLYGGPDGKQLYLLTRQPGKSSSQTNWDLYRIDPHQRQAVGRFPLPSTAPELTLVFSSETLYVIERADLNESGQQRIEHMIEIPMTLVSHATPAATERCR